MDKYGLGAILAMTAFSYAEYIYIYIYIYISFCVTNVNV